MADNTSTKASSGSTQIAFEPDPERSFSRQSTSYFLTGRQSELVNAATPKSMGKHIGSIDTMSNGFVTIRSDETLHNGDGLCFIVGDELFGTRVDRVEGNKVFLGDSTGLSAGVELYRNYDHDFNKLLEADKSVRQVAGTFNVKETANDIRFELQDEDGLCSVQSISPLPELAKHEDQANKNLVGQLSKSGGSMFHIVAVNVDCEHAYFFRASELNSIRRSLFEQQEQLRQRTFSSDPGKPKTSGIPYFKKEVDFTENIANQNAAAIYQAHGVENLNMALELGAPADDQLLMTTRYCIKYELGFCQRFQGSKEIPAEPLYLEDKNRRYRLDFDCKQCLMQIHMLE